MDITKLNKVELDSLSKDIEAQKEKLRQEDLRKREEKAKINVDYLRKYKDVLYKLIDHDRTSCSDTNVCNGWEGADHRIRCRKCLFIEILEGELDDSFEIILDVFINKIQ